MPLKGTQDMVVAGSAYPTFLRNRGLSFCDPRKPPSWEDSHVRGSPFTAASLAPVKEQMFSATCQR